MARVIAVASAKGGVGKTTTAAGLAAALAATDARVVAVDADLGMPNLAAAFGVDVDGGDASDGEAGASVDPAPTSVHDVLAGRGPASAAVTSGTAGVDVLGGATALSAYREADPAGLDDAIADLSDAYDYVILDTGAGLSHDTLVPLGSADEVVLVTTPERDAVGDAARTREVADRIGAAVSGVVLTRVREGDPGTDAVAERLSLPVLGSVPEDDAVRTAAEAGVPVVAHAPHSPVAAAYRRLAASIADVDVPDPDPEPEPEPEQETEQEPESSSTTESEPPAGADAAAVSGSDASAGGSGADAATGPADGTEAATAGGDPVGTAAEADPDFAAGEPTDATAPASTDAASESSADAASDGPFDDGDAPDDVLGEDAPDDLLGGDVPGEGGGRSDLAGGEGQSAGESGPSLGGADAGDDHGPGDDAGGLLDVESDDGSGVASGRGAPATTGGTGTDFDDLGRVGEAPAETEPQDEDDGGTATSGGDHDAPAADEGDGTGPDATADPDGTDSDPDPDPDPDDGDGDGDDDEEDSRGGFLSRLFG
jgi:septum site-determining protein MinD